MPRTIQVTSLPSPQSEVETPKKKGASSFCRNRTRPKWWVSVSSCFPCKNHQKTGAEMVGVLFGFPLNTAKNQGADSQELRRATHGSPAARQPGTRALGACSEPRPWISSYFTGWYRVHHWSPPEAPSDVGLSFLKRWVRKTRKPTSFLRTVGNCLFASYPFVGGFKGKPNGKPCQGSPKRDTPKWTPFLSWYPFWDPLLDGFKSSQTDRRGAILGNLQILQRETSRQRAQRASCEKKSPKKPTEPKRRDNQNETTENTSTQQAPHEKFDTRSPEYIRTGLWGSSNPYLGMTIAASY